MLIEDIFCYVRDQLMTTGIFSRGYEYVELKQVNSSKPGVVVKPQYYEGGGYKDIFNLDVNGMFYVRKRGDSQSGKDTSQKFHWQPCDVNTAIQMTFPCRVVAVVPRSKFTSQRFADDELVNTITVALQGDVTGLGVKSGEIVVGGSNTDAFRIWKEEVQGVEFKERDFSRFTFAAVDFTITIKADSSCLSACQNEY